jgi:lipoyl-dependent peroxiredoxin
MAIRRANAEWKGNLREGTGTIALESGAFRGPYSFKTRFEGDKAGTNPEELIGGAHAGCFSMALGAALTQAGHPPTRIATEAAVHIDKVGDGFKITKIELRTEGQVPGIDEAQFKEFAQKAKEGCPVSRALAGTEITLETKFVTA